MAESLRQKQSRFAGMVARLLVKAQEMGYEVTLGEAYRTPEQSALNARNGTGIRNSLHSMRLAIDLNLFLNGRWLIGSEDHRPLGEWWEKLDPDCRWGGRFRNAHGQPKPVILHVLSMGGAHDDISRGIRATEACGCTRRRPSRFRKAPELIRPRSQGTTDA